MSGGTALVEFYNICKGKELPEALRRLTEAESTVTQLRQIVTQLSTDCTTKDQLCNTLFDLFKKQGRDINNITSKDRFWLNAQLQKHGKELGLNCDGFLDYIKNNKGGEK